jgi:hypothetical protein
MWIFMQSFLPDGRAAKRANASQTSRMRLPLIFFGISLFHSDCRASSLGHLRDEGRIVPDE